MKDFDFDKLPLDIVPFAEFLAKAFEVPPSFRMHLLMEFDEADRRSYAMMMACFDVYLLSKNVIRDPMDMAKSPGYGKQLLHDHWEGFVAQATMLNFKK